MLGRSLAESSETQGIMWRRTWRSNTHMSNYLCLILEELMGNRGTDWYINSLASGKFEWNFRHVIFKQILVIDGWSISCETAQIWMSLDFNDDQSMLVQVMAWCRQATSNYMSQCWPRSLSPYGVTRPQWVKLDLSEEWGLICVYGELDLIIIQEN